MKKIYLLALVVLVALMVLGLYGLDHYRKNKERQREQTAHLLTSCVNQGILTLFRLQANNWKEQPDFYIEEEKRLNAKIEALPAKILDDAPYENWNYAVKMCGKLTRNSNLQHVTIFHPLGDFASADITNVKALKDRGALRKRKKVINALYESSEAADRYMKDLRRDINTQLKAYRFSKQDREAVLQQISSEVLDYYQKGSFSKRQVDTYLERVSQFYKVMAENPKSYSARNGSLFFYKKGLREEVEGIYGAVMQGEGPFYANFKQILVHKQVQSSSL
ncbi:hypothetical protein MO867_01755 [Microbulbifer sp. OS29]|uniref:Uncharacterized protein n=1 Tax=Microbulbifer okhotskensis TaxID=2926617 RepID=A0A9X2EJY5_9GAMM|nr:hypothetical protein [Microbulbifer okhotskensis]MCO1333054.1 hypothetical protein [Microbulbifer okhotskensis]